MTDYKVWLINNDTESTVSIAVISTNKNSGHVWYNFSAPNGVYYVKVAALHPKCGEYGCANSTSPYIHISKDNLARKILLSCNFNDLLNSVLNRISQNTRPIDC